MVDTVSSVFKRLEYFQTRVQRAADVSHDQLVVEAEQLFSTFEETEAQHVQRGLSEESFAFADAQAELRDARLRFARQLAGLQALALSEPQRRALGRIDVLARRAPLTTPADLEVIRAGRCARG